MTSGNFVNYRQEQRWIYNMNSSPLNCPGFIMTHVLGFVFYACAAPGG